MKKLLGIGNLKTYGIVILIAALVYFYKSNQNLRADNRRIEANASAMHKRDSLNYARLTLEKREFKEYLEYNRKDLLAVLDSEKIKLRRINSIITQRLDYIDRDTTIVNLQPILDAIKENKPLRVPVEDKKDCWAMKGYITFENDTLDLEITERRFNNISDVIAYWERNQWSFLGIKTRLFGKKKATVHIVDECGKTETFIIDRRK